MITFYNNYFTLVLGILMKYYVVYSVEMKLFRYHLKKSIFCFALTIIFLNLIPFQIFLISKIYCLFIPLYNAFNDFQKRRIESNFKLNIRLRKFV